MNKPQRNEQVLVKLSQEEMNYIVKMAEAEWEGNKSAALRYCIRVAKGLDEKIETLEKQVQDV